MRPCALAAAVAVLAAYWVNVPSLVAALEPPWRPSSSSERALTAVHRAETPSSQRKLLGDNDRSTLAEDAYLHARGLKEAWQHAGQVQHRPPRNVGHPRVRPGSNSLRGFGLGHHRHGEDAADFAADADQDGGGIAAGAGGSQQQQQEEKEEQPQGPPDPLEEAWGRADGAGLDQAWRRAEGEQEAQEGEAKGEEEQEEPLLGSLGSNKEAGAGAEAAGMEVDWESFSSVGRVGRAHVDLEAEGGMDAAIAARSCEREVIFFLAEESFFTATLNFIVNLHSVGLAHWMMLTSTEHDCDTFDAALHQILPEEPSGCVWSQLHADNAGWPHHGLEHSKYKKLQILKMHYPGVLIERGLNVLYADVDVAFPRSFYPDVKSPPFADKELLCQKDSTICNTGLVYCQNADPAGPVQWLWAEATRRILEGLNPDRNFTSRSGNRVEPGPGSLLIWEQEIFGDCVISAVMGAETRIGQYQSKQFATPEEHEALRKMSESFKTPLTLTIPGGTAEAEKSIITVGDDLLFLSFPDYLARQTRPEFHEKQPMLHCVGAPRGPAKKFCLSAFGFWDFTVDRVGLNPGMLGGVPEKLRTEKWLRLAPGHEPSTRDKWLRAVQLLFQAAVVMGRRAIIPDVPCSSTGWSFHEVIHSGGPPGSAQERCVFNNVLMRENHQCTPQMDGAAVPQFMWDKIMAVGGPSRWRPDDSPPCGFHVAFVGDPVKDREQAVWARDMELEDGCVHILGSGGPEERAAAELPPPLPLETEEQGKLDQLEGKCQVPKQ